MQVIENVMEPERDCYYCLKRGHMNKKIELLCKVYMEILRRTKNHGFEEEHLLYLDETIDWNLDRSALVPIQAYVNILQNNSEKYNADSLREYREFLELMGIPLNEKELDKDYAALMKPHSGSSSI